MRLLYIITFLTLISCNHNKLITYDDYLIDKGIYQKIIQMNLCKSKLNASKNIKTIDFIHKFNNHYSTSCDGNLDLLKTDINIDIINVLDQMMTRDQESRENFELILYDSNINWYSDNLNNLSVIDKHNFNLLFDSIVGKADKKNQKVFDSLIRSEEQWIGSNYIPRKIGYPKLDVLVGHWSTNLFEKYTLMAYESAMRNEEYWSRVISMVGYSFKYPINDKMKSIYPFRFSEFNSENLDTKSGLTNIEFDFISKQLRNYNLKEELLQQNFDSIIVDEILKNHQANDNSDLSIIIRSSVENQKNRRQLLLQTKEKLINLGVSKDKITLNTEIYPDKTYLLYYEIK